MSRPRPRGGRCVRGWGAAIAAAAGVTLLEAVLVTAGLAGTEPPAFLVRNIGSQQLGKPQLAFDAGGVPHVAVFDAGAHRIAYGTRVDTTWSFETAASYTSSLAYLSMALDPEGQPHVVFGDQRQGSGGPVTVTWAHRTDAGWLAEDVVTATGLAFFSVRVGPDSVPRIVCRAGGGPEVWYMTRDSAGWSVEVVGDSSGAKTSPVLALDGSGRAHLAYYDLTRRELVYATRGDSTWAFEDVAPVDGTFRHCVLALDATARPRIVYYDPDSLALLCATRSAGSWTIEAIERRTPAPWMSLALTGAGEPRVAYTDSLFGTLHYAVRTGGAWEAFTPDMGYCTSPSIALDSLDAPHLCYRVVDRDGLDYASPAPPGEGAISGSARQVCEGNDIAAAGVRIVLQRGGDGVDSTLTDAAGGFAFSPVALGTYTISTRSTPSWRARTPDTLVTVAFPGETVPLELGMECRLFSIPVSVSNNAGMARDPSVVRTPEGNLLVAWGCDPLSVDYASSPDDGATWAVPHRYAYETRRPALALSDSGRIVMVATFDSLCMGTSGDGGLRMDPGRVTIDQREGWSTRVAAGLPGHLHVAYQRAAFGGHGDPGGGEGVFYARSLDGGASFSGPLGLGIDLASPRSMNLEPRLAVTSGDSVFVCWSYTPDLWAPAGSRIVLSRSLDGGATFSDPVALTDTAAAGAVTALGDLQADSRGTLHLVWARGGSPDTLVYLRSTDAGASFHEVGRGLLPYSGGNSRIDAFAFAPDGSIDAVLPGGYWLESHDGGVTWTDPVLLQGVPFGDQYRIVFARDGTPAVVHRGEVASSMEIYFSRKVR